MTNWNLQAAFISVSCTAECEFLSLGTCEMQGSDSMGQLAWPQYEQILPGHTLLWVNLR